MLALALASGGPCSMHSPLSQPQRPLPLQQGWLNRGCGCCLGGAATPPRQRTAAEASELGLLAPAACWAFNWVFHNPFCAALFRCGCTWNWAGGWADCNVHNPSGPRCPWCNVMNTSMRGAATLITDWWTVLVMVCCYTVCYAQQRKRSIAASGAPGFDEIEMAKQSEQLLPPTGALCEGAAGRAPAPAGSRSVFWSTPQQLAVRATVAAAAFVMWGLGMGLLWKVQTGYPCFLWIVDVETHCGGKASW